VSAAKKAPARKPAVKRIQLEDQGQDFLEWDLDEDGVVVDCRPAQSWLWIGVRVVNDRTLRRGSKLQVITNSGDEITLNYPAAMVTKLAVPARQVA
jgi:hypothetical protein